MTACFLSSHQPLVRQENQWLITIESIAVWNLRFLFLFMIDILWESFRTSHCIVVVFSPRITTTRRKFSFGTFPLRSLPSRFLSNSIVVVFIALFVVAVLSSMLSYLLFRPRRVVPRSFIQSFLLSVHEFVHVSWFFLYFTIAKPNAYQSYSV
ncbi:hypothetical protein PM082_012127 [Marasmius tenuissimus]|nr:hypothetical protein PM082_012127 [Marasmius tenuissimus]